MRALVLEKVRELRLRDIELPTELGPDAVTWSRRRPRNCMLSMCSATPTSTRKPLSLLASGKIDVKPLISKILPFEKAVDAFEFAAQGSPSVVKTQIVFE
jgi:threonine dehydrogenase-like Zn-dependent dehydrogenase